MTRKSRVGNSGDEAFEAAEADFSRALKLEPGADLRYGLLTQRALLRLRADRLAEATADLDLAIQVQPNAYQAHTTMAQVLQRQERLADADTSFGRAIACHPEPPVLAGLYRSRALLRASRPGITPAQQDAALQDLAEAIRREPDGALKAADHVSRARLFFRAHQRAEALADCDAAIALVPHDPECAPRADRDPDGIEAVRRGARLGRRLPRPRQADRRDPRDPRPGPGGAKGLRGAIADFNRALDQKPATEPAQRSRLLNRRGWAYQYSDAPRLARSDFEESLRLEPNQSDAYSGRGLARIRLGDWRPAVADAEAAIRRSREAVPIRRVRTRQRPRSRPSSMPRGSTPRPSSSRPGTSAGKVNGRYHSIAAIAPAPWICSMRPSSRNPIRRAGQRSSTTPPCDRSGCEPPRDRPPAGTSK